MSQLEKIRNEFINGDLTKHEYIDRMYKSCHSHLFDYASFISQTDIKEIRIFDNEVLMLSKKFNIGMFCPNGDHRVAPIETLNFFRYEEKDSSMILNLIPENGVFFDIGANMGWYSLVIARSINNISIHSFEPIPKTFNFLEKNIKFNKFENVLLHNFGFSDKTKDLTFYTYPEGSGNASAANLTDRSDVEKINCKVVRLDDFVESNGLCVDFIKCDVEGAELLTFIGAKKTIERDKPVVFSEMLRKWAAKFNYHPNDIIKYFSDLGYSCFISENTYLSPIYEITDDTEETNFFFLHKEKHKSYINKYQR